MTVMTTTDLRVDTGIKIMKPAHDVYEAIVDPQKMLNWFISKGSGRLDEGLPVFWTWDDMKMQAEIRPSTIEVDRFISWWSSTGGDETLVEIRLDEVELSATVVNVTETGWQKTDQGIHMLARQTAGWAGFLANLKAFLEHGINLRKDAFDLSMMPAKTR